MAPIKPASAVTAGTVAQAPEAGIAFSVPAGFSGAHEPSVRGVILSSAQERIRLGVWGVSQATVDQLAERVGEMLAVQGIIVQEQVSRNDVPGGFNARFQVATEEGPGFIAASVRGGEHGNAVAFVALGRPDSGDRLDALLAEIVQTVRLTRPQALDWHALLAGRRLYASGGGSDYSPDASGGGSGVSASQTTMDLCSDGTYAFSSRRETYVSIAGASASRTSGDEHSGEWALVADLAGEAILVLSASDGREFFWAIEETDNGARVDGNTYGVEASPVCG